MDRGSRGAPVALLETAPGSTGEIAIPARLRTRHTSSPSRYTEGRRVVPRRILSGVSCVVNVRRC